MGAENSVLIDNITAITMDGSGRVIEDAAIAVDSGVIKYVGPASEMPAEVAPKGARRIDGRGKVAIPGLVNSHTHAAMVLFRGYGDDLALQEWLTHKIFPIEAKLTSEDVYWGTLLACVEMIKSGSTCFADMYFFMDETARAVEEAGMRAALSIGMASVSGDAAAKLADATAFCERWNGAAGGRITTMLAPHAPYTCSADFMTEVGKRARALGVGVHTHVSETFKEVREIRALQNMSPVEFIESTGLFDAPTLAAHCVAVSDGDIDILAKHGVRVAHNPGSNMKLASGIAPIPKMLERGIAVGLGTDGAASNNNLDMIEEARLTALLHKAATQEPTIMPAYQCLNLATIGGATCLGIQDLIGSLEVGKRADIAIMDFRAPHLTPAGTADPVSHVVYAASPADVVTVVIDGKIVMENRKLTTLDEQEIMTEVEKRAARLVSETGGSK